jgi:hypothetical protein
VTTSTAHARIDQPQALAIAGGLPVRPGSWPQWPTFASDEVEAAAHTLRSGKVNYWTGEEGRAFEREFADYVGVDRAIACSNGTAALELALLGLDIGPDAEVLVPSRTFIATASAVVARGARPVVADIDRDSGNVTVRTLEAALTPSTRAVIVVHLGGWPCDMDEIAAFCRAHDLALVEDCAQAHGAAIAGRRVGSFGDAAAFSFCQDKIMTTGGEGGMVTTDRLDVWRRAWSYKDHGKSYAAVHSAHHPPGFRWLHASFGSNMRMTEMQAAIGRRQLAKLDAWVAKRRALALHLVDRIGEHPALRVPLPAAPAQAAFYRVYAYLRPETLRRGWSRDRIMQAIAAEGVPCQTGSCSEIYREQAFTGVGRPRAALPVAEELGATSLVFLTHPTLEIGDMDDTAEAVLKVLSVATRAT